MYASTIHTMTLTFDPMTLKLNQFSMHVSVGPYSQLCVEFRFKAVQLFTS